ncbi:MAG: nickel-dependent hydrogenase large subunit [Spirochaetales bacterium]|nr:nickel-dependent hydrogenase large subunit [Spirochaetales bacterium]
MAVITIDPLTRIEGHLKIELDVNLGVVTGARASGTMARGIEKLLKGKDPRDATYVTERICGVCFSAHGWASSLAVEKAHGTENIPNAARLLRNLIAGACWLHDHMLHFYHLSAVDYLDLGVLSQYTGTDTYLNKIRDQLIAELNNPPLEGEYIGPFLPAYAPDDFSIHDLDTVATLVTHYLQALEMQVKAKKMSALFGGKQPHQSGIITGGVTEFPQRIKRDEFQILLNEVRAFVENVYVADVINVGTGPLAQLAMSEVGVGYGNYLSYGGFPEKNGHYLYPEGAMIEGILSETSRPGIEPHITEDVTHGWYEPGTGGHPSQTIQEFDLDKTGAYSFVKAPRFKGQPMEVGPLARMMIAANRMDENAYYHHAVQTFISLVNQGVQPGAVARHAARALETLMLCDGLQRWLNELNVLNGGRTVPIHDTEHWDPPVTGNGYGMIEAPRGSLGHWINIQDHKIDRYACVVPTTWNASPVDEYGIPGPYEKALIGCPVPDPENPINVGRIIRSFDPCIACAVHILTAKKETNHLIIG